MDNILKMNILIKIQVTKYFVVVNVDKLIFTIGQILTELSIQNNF